MTVFFFEYWLITNNTRHPLPYDYTITPRSREAARLLDHVDLEAC
jgi:hypothetical protein